MKEIKDKVCQSRAAPPITRILFCDAVGGGGWGGGGGGLFTRSGLVKTLTLVPSGRRKSVSV